MSNHLMHIGVKVAGKGPPFLQTLDHALIVSEFLIRGAFRLHVVVGIDDIPELLRYHADYFANRDKLPYRNFPVAVQNRSCRKNGGVGW